MSVEAGRGWGRNGNHVLRGVALLILFFSPNYVYVVIQKPLYETMIKFLYAEDVMIYMISGTEWSIIFFTRELDMLPHKIQYLDHNSGIILVTYNRLKGKYQILYRDSRLNTILLQI